MGEVERIRPSLGSTFGHDLGPRINSLGDRRPKKHDHEEAEHPKEDALELHEESVTDAQPIAPHLYLESSDHLDLSA